MQFPLKQEVVATIWKLEATDGFAEKRRLQHAWEDGNSQSEIFPLCQETERVSTERRASLKKGENPKPKTGLRLLLLFTALRQSRWRFTEPNGTRSQPTAR